jgi:hypothetical protein
MKRYALPILFCLLFTSPAFGQNKAPVEGVWKIVELVMPGGNLTEKGTTVTNPQPGLMIFTRGYYSTVIVSAEQPRAAVTPAKDPKNLTDAEKIARYEEWRPFIAASGSYEIQGSTIVRHVMVAKNVNVMTRETPTIWEFKLEGTNTLRLIPTGNLVTTEPRLS